MTRMFECLTEARDGLIVVRHQDGGLGVMLVCFMDPTKAAVFMSISRDRRLSQPKPQL